MSTKTLQTWGAAALLCLALTPLACSDGGSGATVDASGGEPQSPCDGAEQREGEGTYYGADGTGNCSFEPSAPEDMTLVAAMNETDYAGSAACGACVRVTGPAGEVTVKIVDRCPECAPGDVDLSQHAFEQIAELSAGRVPISWQYVPCDVSGALSYRYKEGSSEWWTGIQVLNHRHAISSLEYSDDGGSSWVEVPRLNYNYFVQESGMGPGPYTLRVTDVEGNAVIEEDVPLQADGVVAGDQQFPTCG